MKLLGKDITADKLMQKVEAKLRARGLIEEPQEPIVIRGVEPRVDPLSFNLRALEENSDPTIPLPRHTHRDGLGRMVLFAKYAFRSAGQVFINEALGRQRLFNGHVRDSYAQLSAEVLRLREELSELKAQTASAGAARKTPREATGAERKTPRTMPKKK